jgi:hypothetical protein
LGVGFIGAYPLPSLLVFPTLFVAWGVKAWITTVDKDHARKVERMRQLEQDADYEHHFILDGDDRGTFGRYPPAF